MEASTNKYDYDVIVIGSGPAGQKAAIQAAKLGKRVAIIESNPEVGGVCLRVGTIPSKTLRETVVYLSGYRLHGVYGRSYAVKHDITLEDLMVRGDHVIDEEVDVTRHQLQRNKVEIIHALASFVDPHTLHLDYTSNSGTRDATAEFVVIAVGSYATKDPHIQFDGKNIFTSDDMLSLDELPATLAIVGGGVIGVEYASIFAALGIRVTLIDKRDALLSFIDEEVIDTLIYHLRQQRVVLRLGEEVSEVEMIDDENESVRLTLESGKKIQAEKALYSIGRTGATAGLNLEAAGIEADKRGRLSVNKFYQTEVPHIYAVGDVIGFPGLASTSMGQGRLATLHAFGHEVEAMPEVFPYGIYSVPEISTVGRTEAELTGAGIPYEVGKAQYNEVARGQIMGDNTGLLKILFHLDTREVLGVHIIGESASELIHIGQAVMNLNGTIDYFVDAVFNYPTLAECYRIAALDGVNRMVVAE